MAQQSPHWFIAFFYLLSISSRLTDNGILSSLDGSSNNLPHITISPFMTWKQTVNNIQIFAETTPSSVVGLSSRFDFERTFGQIFLVLVLRSAHPALNLTLTIAWSLIHLLLLLLDHFGRCKCSSRNCLRRNSTQFSAQSYVSPFFGVEIFRIEQKIFTYCSVI